MRIGTRIAMVALAASMSLGVANAADATFTLGGHTFTMRTNTSGGQCTVTPLGGSAGVDVDCVDGTSRAKGNTNTGCVYSAVAGQCISGSLPTHTHCELSIPCPGGNTFTISTGDTDSTSKCNHEKGSTGSVTGGHCGRDNGSNSADVDCTANGGLGSCESSSGSGTCHCDTCSPPS